MNLTAQPADATHITEAPRPSRWRRWGKRAAIGGAGLILAALAGGLALPDAYAVERAVTIDASPEVIHERVRDLRRWPEWTPWSKQDESIVLSYGERTAGVGAHQSWTGCDGEGELTFTSCSRTGVTYTLAFDGGAHTAQGRIRYERAGNGTKVTWRFAGDADGSLSMRYLALLLRPMLGKQLAGGLNRLKALSESR